jgi:glycosyltransferase involved in cell wall biosynthesis
MIEDEKTGMLVQVIDGATFADAIDHLLQDRELRERMAQAARISARARIAASPLIRGWEDLLILEVSSRRVE